jgi:hypothetical protein
VQKALAHALVQHLAASSEPNKPTEARLG